MSGEAFRQGLDENEAERPGGPFVIELLFREPAVMSSKERIYAVIERHVGKVGCFCHDGRATGSTALDYRAEFQDQSVPVQLVVTVYTASDDEEIDDFLRSQMWGCLEERDRILGNCCYHVTATDMLTGALPAAKCVILDMDFLEALSELYLDCEAFYFPSSGKLFTVESVRRDETEGINRFIYSGVNARFFNMQDNKDMVVDTLGTDTLFLPDSRYHFHGMSLNWVVNHAHNVATYLLGGGNVIANGETVDGIVDEEVNSALHQSYCYEAALTQPPGEVLGANMDKCVPRTR